MTSPTLRREVLRCFKRLHKARKTVFNEDDYALTFTRSKINEEFQKQKNETNAEKIKELVTYGYDVEKELLTVMQFKEVEPGKLQLKVRPENLIKNAECKIDQ